METKAKNTKYYSHCEEIRNAIVPSGKLSRHPNSDNGRSDGKKADARFGELQTLMKRSKTFQERTLVVSLPAMLEKLEEIIEWLFFLDKLKSKAFLRLT